MKCPYCNQNAGFFKLRHSDCKISADNTLKQIESILCQYRNVEIVPQNVKLQIKEIAQSNSLYKNYLYSMIFDKTVINKSEAVLYVESQMSIMESKNRCKMVATGYRYEKMPTLSENKILLDKSGTIIFTDKAIYLAVANGTMRYPYSKIVNYGIEKEWSRFYAYFDVKTSSPFPHRFSFMDNFNDKYGEKERRIYRLLNVL